jgi:2-dehydropantoate 2-reductase
VLTLLSIFVESEHSRRALAALLVFALIHAVGTVGYLLIGGPATTVIDALYMTFISVATIGYAEVVDLSASPAGRVFTMVIALLGIGTMTFLFSTVTAFVLETNQSSSYRRRRMQARIARLDGHYIVCGAGRIGGHVVAELQAGRQTWVALDTDPAALAGAEVVLFCVKSRDTDTGGRALAPLLRPDAVLVSLQNGVDNPVRLRAASGRDTLAAAVYVACSMSGPGEVRHAGRGDLILGPVPGASGASGLAQAQRVAALFERAGVPCPVVPDARPALWEKLVMNCVFNAISALGRARYARLVADAGARALMAEVVAECVAVAGSEGVPLPPTERLVADALRLGAAMADATSSMAQDLAAGRPTEIDALNGLVVRLGEAAGVPVAVNRALSTLVRLAEAG